MMATSKAGKVVASRSLHRCVDSWKLRDLKARMVVTYHMGHTLKEMGFTLQPQRIVPSTSPARPPVSSSHQPSHRQRSTTTAASHSSHSRIKSAKSSTQPRPNKNEGIEDIKNVTVKEETYQVNDPVGGSSQNIEVVDLTLESDDDCYSLSEHNQGMSNDIKSERDSPNTTSTGPKHKLLVKLPHKRKSKQSIKIPNPKKKKSSIVVEKGKDSDGNYTQQRASRHEQLQREKGKSRKDSKKNKKEKQSDDDIEVIERSTSPIEEINICSEDESEGEQAIKQLNGCDLEVDDIISQIDQVEKEANERNVFHIEEVEIEVGNESGVGCQDCEYGQTSGEKESESDMEIEDDIRGKQSDLGGGCDHGAMESDNDNNVDDELDDENYVNIDSDDHSDSHGNKESDYGSGEHGNKESDHGSGDHVNKDADCGSSDHGNKESDNDSGDHGNKESDHDSGHHGNKESDDGSGDHGNKGADCGSDNHGNKESDIDNHIINKEMICDDVNQDEIDVEDDDDDDEEEALVIDEDIEKGQGQLEIDNNTEDVAEAEAGDQEADEDYLSLQ